METFVKCFQFGALSAITCITNDMNRQMKEEQEKRAQEIAELSRKVDELQRRWW